MSHVVIHILFIVIAEASAEIVWHSTEINIKPCEIDQSMKL